MAKRVVAIAGVVVLFTLRAILFCTHYAGIEHDSGWYLGVAKNLALRGKYAAYTNTVIQEGSGEHPSIHGRFSVQDDEGFIYFPSGVSAGPGYVLPEALAIKLFGSGWWQYRLWPMLAYVALLGLSLSLLLRLGGWLPVCLFSLWLWMIPQFTVEFAYEAFSEHIALLYLLLSFTLFAFSLELTAERKKNLYLLLSGICLGGAIETKVLFLLMGVAFVPFFLRDLALSRKASTLLNWVSLAIGLLLPIGAFESYRFFFLTHHFGIEAYRANNREFAMLFRHDGSGLEQGLGGSSGLLVGKIRIWSDVALRWFPIAWLFFIGSGALILEKTDRFRRALVSLFYVGAMGTFAWFVILSPTGWARHAWHALFLGMMLICLFAAQLAYKGLPFAGVQSFNKNRATALVLLAALLLSLRPDMMDPRLHLDINTVKQWWRLRSDRGFFGFPPNAVFSREDQQGLVDFFASSVHSQDQVYFVEGFLMAEISPLVDKVFYPLARYPTLSSRMVGGKSLVILGPYQHGPWTLVGPDYAGRVIPKVCAKTLFSNSSYFLCELKQSIFASKQ